MKPLYSLSRLLLLLLFAGLLFLSQDSLLAGKKSQTPVKIKTERVTGPNQTENTEITSADTQLPQLRDVDESRSDPEVHWQVMSSGGGMCNVGEFILGSTLGQPPVGLSAVGDFTLHSGFWQDFDDGYLCGDVDNSGTVNIADAVYLIGYIFGGPAPEIMASADVDCSGTTNMADAVYLIGFIFGVNPNPCDPDGNGIPDCP